MKKEIIGRVIDLSSEAKNYWTFENTENHYSINVVNAIDELLGIWSRNGDRFKITIEKLN